MDEKENNVISVMVVLILLCVLIFFISESIVTKGACVVIGAILFFESFSMINKIQLEKQNKGGKE